MKKHKIYTYKAHLIKVIDGDTVVLTIDIGFSIAITETLRIFGVDTPEKRTRNPIEKKAGIMASDFVWNTLEKEVDKNGYLIVETCRDKGKYGRYMVDIKIGNTTLSKLLIKKHLAVAYFGQSKKEITPDHEKNYKKLGLAK